MKKIFCIIIFIISLALISCSHDSNYYLKEISNECNIQHLNEAKTTFFYKKISGIDSSGILYFVLEFENKPLEFLSQFIEDKKSDFVGIGNGKNESFETKVNALISSHFENDYLQFEKEYQINWDLPYMYINDTPDYVTLPMIYFENSFQLIIIKLIM